MWNQYYIKLIGSAAGGMFFVGKIFWSVVTSTFIWNIGSIIVFFMILLKSAIEQNGHLYYLPNLRFVWENSNNVQIGHWNTNITGILVMKIANRHEVWETTVRNLESWLKIVN